MDVLSLCLLCELLFAVYARHLLAGPLLYLEGFYANLVL